MHSQIPSHTSRSERHAAARSEVSAVLGALLRGEAGKMSTPIDTSAHGQFSRAVRRKT